MRFAYPMLAIVATALSACNATPVPNDNVLSKGEIQGIRKNGMVIKDKDSVLFIETTNSAALKQLKKGDKITLIGRKSGGPKAKDGSSFEEYQNVEVITDKGKRIVLTP